MALNSLEDAKTSALKLFVIFLAQHQNELDILREKGSSFDEHLDALHKAARDISEAEIELFKALSGGGA